PAGRCRVGANRGDDDHRVGRQRAAAAGRRHRDLRLPLTRMADRFGAPREILRSAITHLAFPCAVVEVGDSTHPLWSESLGHLTFGADSPAATTATIFDLASLTKVLST